MMSGGRNRLLSFILSKGVFATGRGSSNQTKTSYPIDNRRYYKSGAGYSTPVGSLWNGIFPGGVPAPVSYLYPCVLGAVLFGIGIALLLEVWHGSKGIRGLGIGGAIVINFCGAGTLLGWLLMSPHDMPLRGQILLWTIAVMVLLVGVVELFTRSWQE